MNYSDIKNKCINKKFLILFIVIFVILFIIFGFLRFLGQLPILLILAFFITYYSNEYMLTMNYNIFSEDDQKNILQKIIKETKNMKEESNSPVYEEYENYQDNSWETF